MSASDRNVGIEVLKEACAKLTTFQTLVFDLLGSSEHPKFRDFLKILKDGTDPNQPLDLITLPEHMVAW